MQGVERVRYSVHLCCRLLLEEECAAHVDMTGGFRHGGGLPVLVGLLYGLQDVLQPLAGEEPVLQTDFTGLVKDVLRIVLLESQHHVAGLVVVLRRT